MRKWHFLLVFVVGTTLLFGEEQPTVYLTWQSDPTTTMMVRWLTDNKQHGDEISYQPIQGGEWKTLCGSHRSLPGVNLFLHSVEMTHLLPNTSYHLRIKQLGSTYKFQTMPKELCQPLRFVIGGDVYHDDAETFTTTCDIAAKSNPHFAFLGGDIAYGSSKPVQGPDDADRWLKFIKLWSKHMIAPNGNIIPVLTAIGNHDVNGRYGQTPEGAPFYYTLFAPHPQAGYYTMDFGKYLSLIVLDSGHTHPIEGNQAHWLFHALNARCQVPYIFAIYHVPAYPSVRKFTSKRSTPIRQHWVPLFEQFGITAAFEHHDHSYKRSHPIYQNKVDHDRGILYLGDGGWGVKEPRQPAKEGSRFYIAKAFRERNFIQVDLTKETATFTAIDSSGTPFDSTQKPPRKKFPT